MGLGRLLRPLREQHRTLTYTVSDSATGQFGYYTVLDSLGPDWPTSDPYKGAMGIPGCWRAANLIADLLAQVPWDAYRKADPPSLRGLEQTRGSTDDVHIPTQRIDPRPHLLDQPSPPDTRHTTLKSLVLDYLWHGNGVAVVTGRDALERPTACKPVAATSVSVRRVPRNDPQRSGRPVGSIEYKVGDQTFDAQDIIHFKGPVPAGQLRGMGIVESQVSTITLAKDQQRQASGVTNHGVPTGVLKSDNPDLTGAEAADMKAAWMAARASGGVAVLNATTEFVPLSWSPTDLQMVEARRLNLSEIELIFGFPVGWLGGMNSARQYSNVEMDAVNLLKFTLSGHLSQFEQTFSLLFPRGTHVRADLDVILRADILTRFKAYEIGIDKGILLRTEARSTEHLPPLTAEMLRREKQIRDALSPVPAIGGDSNGSEGQRPAAGGSVNKNGSAGSANGSKPSSNGNGNGRRPGVLVRP